MSQAKEKVTRRRTRRSQPGEPTWEVALLFPRQGDWTFEEYLHLSERTDWKIELVNGRVEVLHTPPEAPVTRRGQPPWEIAYLFPRQGSWTLPDYFALATNDLVELSDGCLEVLPMPSDLHQAISAHLYGLLMSFVVLNLPGGRVRYASLPVLLPGGKTREPDVLYMAADHVHRCHFSHWEGADLVMEIVSEGAENRKRDLETKPIEYAEAGIPEYWIIDPELQRITVLTLDGKTYRVHGEFAPGSQATSVLLPGFSVDVTAVFAVPASRN